MGRTEVAVIGCGTMGMGITRACVAHGMNLVLHDVDEARAGALASSLTGVRVGSSLADAVAGADVVIETVPELLELKAHVISEIHAAARPDALVATNTSTISIVALETKAGCPGGLIGMHFFNPAEKQRLVEIVRGPDTPEDLVTRATDFAGVLGKTAIVINDLPGFVTSRLGLALGTEAMRLRAAGAATTSAIDTAMRLGYGHPMGPLELADLVGLDARLNNLRSLFEASGDERYRPPEILEDLVAQGFHGRKSGRGFYYYVDGRRVGEAPLGPDA